jgi:VIT1/CCC1 family predicted Fe2+/Mn2+ transporter
MIAIADAMSDALGMHLSEESSSRVTNRRQIWESTISTFVFKFIFASIFIIPFLFFDLKIAMQICILMGLLILGIFSYYIAKKHKTNPVAVILEHVVIAIIVIILTYYVGVFVNSFAV